MENRFQNIKEWVFNALVPILISAFPVIFLYSSNADQVALNDVVASLIPFIGFALVGYLIFGFCLRRASKAALCAGIVTFVFTNFSVLEKLLLIPFPHLHYWHTTSIFLLAVILLFYFIIMKVQISVSNEISKVLVIIFAGLLVINIAIAMPNTIKKFKVDAPIATEDITQSKNNDITLR